MHRLVVASLVTALVVGCRAGRQAEAPAGANSFWPVCDQLHHGRFVELTHAFDENIPHFSAFPAMQVKDLFRIEQDGFWAQEFRHVGQWGTHVDPPAHFHEGLRTVDEIPLAQMIMPLVVIDVHEKVANRSNCWPTWIRFPRPGLS